MTVEERARRVQLLLFDVDGVLTDGVVVMHADGSESKGFHIKDGAAIVWAQRAGLPVGLLSARSSGATAHRAAQLAVRIVQQGVTSKASGLRSDPEDRQRHRGSGVVHGRRPARSAGARRAAAWRRRRRTRSKRCARPCTGSAPSPGGRGAVRELIELVLRAQGRWDDGRRRARRAALMEGSLTLLAVLIALLAGLAIGKAWERYKLQDGRWIDRRRGRESPHFILGLNFLVANQIDRAIDELTKAAELAGDPLEIRLILGNLYREKGQVGRAIQEHQALLQRPSLRKLEHANVAALPGPRLQERRLRRPRAVGVHRRPPARPRQRYALSNLEKLYEEQHQWDDAYKTRQKLAALDGPEHQAGAPRDPRVPRERARHPGAEADGLRRSRAAGSRRRSSSTPPTRRRS